MKQRTTKQGGNVLEITHWEVYPPDRAHSWVLRRRNRSLFSLCRYFVFLVLKTRTEIVFVVLRDAPAVRDVDNKHIT